MIPFYRNKLQGVLTKCQEFFAVTNWITPPYHDVGQQNFTKDDASVVQT